MAGTRAKRRMRFQLGWTPARMLEFRETQGWSREDLATRLAVTPFAVKVWEQAIHDPTRSVRGLPGPIQRLMEVLSENPARWEPDE